LKKPTKYDIEREAPTLPIIDDSTNLRDLLAALFSLFEARIYHF
jgi:biotin-(acetyl-CoA carboxylase) ligase